MEFILKNIYQNYYKVLGGVKMSTEMAVNEKNSVQSGKETVRD